MSEMQCAGVRRDLQSAMCAVSKMQCVPSSLKTYPSQYNDVCVFECFTLQKRGLQFLRCVEDVTVSRVCIVRL
jgi:hypothetical protein